MSVPETQAPWHLRPWRRAVVYGMGLSGGAAARLLESRGVAVVAVDDRGEAAGSHDGMAVREPREMTDWADVDGVVVSPGVPPDRPLLRAARELGLPVVGEVELAFPLLRGPVVGITGSNGKSTTTALTTRLLETAGRAAEACGNIGRPLADAVAGPEDRIFVTELSSFQLETVDAFRPRAAALLNLSADHLDRHDSLEAYSEAKARLFGRQTAEDVAVFNADDPGVTAVAEGVAGPRRRFFSSRRPVTDGCYVDGDRVLEVEPGDESTTTLFVTADLQLPGVHNLENAMASALLARYFGVAPADLERGVRGFRGLPHRTQLVAVRGGVAWYDDSKGTNPAATLRSLEGFEDGAVHLVLGGRDKGADAGELVPVVRRKARVAYLIGEAAALFAAALDGHVELERCGDLGTAVRRAAERARPGEAVLLSPACASFDQYASYADRGEHFQRLVRELPEVVDG